MNIMKFSTFRRALIALSFGLTLSAGLIGVSHAQPDQRIVSIGNSVTEIIYALGEGDRLVGRDRTSRYPAEALELPDLGYIRALGSEGILSVRPTMIVTEEGAGPPEAIAVLEEAALPMITIPEAYSEAGIVAKILAVGEALDVPQKAQDLAKGVSTDLQAVADKVAHQEAPAKRVMFILSTQGGRITASGTGTGADAIIRMAGAQNALTSFEGYKQLTAEAVTIAAPDVILMMDRGGDHSSSLDELFAMPSLITTPAAQKGALVRIEGGLLLGFGPRTPQAVQQLHAEVYGQD